MFDQVCQDVCVYGLLYSYVCIDLCFDLVHVVYGIALIDDAYMGFIRVFRLMFVFIQATYV